MPTASRIVIGVAGRIGSGKSMVAHALEREFGFQYLRYSLVLADWFEVDPADKLMLQKIGGEVMAGEGQRELNRRLIAKISPERDAAVDGLRHPIDHESLTRALGLHYSLVFVDTPATIRFERTRNRYKTASAFHEADSRPVEANIERLRPMATAMIAGTLTAGELTSELGRITENLRQRTRE